MIKIHYPEFEILLSLFSKELEYFSKSKRISEIIDQPLRMKTIYRHIDTFFCNHCMIKKKHLLQAEYKKYIFERDIITDETLAGKELWGVLFYRTFKCLKCETVTFKSSRLYFPMRYKDEYGKIDFKSINMDEIYIESFHPERLQHFFLN